MHSIRSIRWCAVVLLAGGGLACAQATLPATSATALPNPQANAAAAPASAGRAHVEFADGMLAITADNSSLNQILREISKQTGMKVTGGVTDERVFGKYGPAPAAEILADLLAGTSSNMLLRETATKAPAELILTPREGGPTPPNPNAPGLTEEDERSQTPPPPPPPQPAMAPQPPPGPPATGGALPNGPAGANGATPGADPNAPNGAQSPQQIFEQLQRLQNTQQQSAPK